MHVVELLRINDDVTLSTDELLALPEHEAMSMVTTVGAAFATPGNEGYGIVDLTPGRCLGLCPIPQGVTPEVASRLDADEAAPAGSAPDPTAPAGPELGPPHFTLGMIHEFAVT